LNGVQCLFFARARRATAQPPVQQLIARSIYSENWHVRHDPIESGTSTDHLLRVWGPSNVPCLGFLVWTPILYSVLALETAKRGTKDEPWIWTYPCTSYHDRGSLAFSFCRKNSWKTRN
ncbi:hypothetical protein B0I72DRAFT_141560, partial [Yarrowia lipolytica]